MREQRRSRRIPASIPLEIQSDGEPQPALTGAINLNGALILSPVNLPVGSDLRIKVKKRLSAIVLLFPRTFFLLSHFLSGEYS
jgi:PilZ domain